MIAHKDMYICSDFCPAETSTPAGPKNFLGKRMVKRKMLIHGSPESFSIFTRHLSVLIR